MAAMGFRKIISWLLLVQVENKALIQHMVHHWGYRCIPQAGRVVLAPSLLRGDPRGCQVVGLSLPRTSLRLQLVSGCHICTSACNASDGTHRPVCECVQHMAPPIKTPCMHTEHQPYSCMCLTCRRSRSTITTLVEEKAGGGPLVPHGWMNESVGLRITSHCKRVSPIKKTTATSMMGLKAQWRLDRCSSLQIQRQILFPRSEAT